MVELFQKLVGFQGNALNRTPQSAKLSRLQSAFSLFASFSLPQDEKEKKKVSPSGDRQLGQASACRQLVACLVVIVRQGSGREAPTGDSLLVQL